MSKASVPESITEMAAKHAKRWQDRNDAYWLMRLMQEVGELASSLAGDHKDPPEHELAQIGSIAVNWLRKRAEERRPLTDEEIRERQLDRYLDEQQ